LPIVALSYSLRHIAHISNDFFKVADELLQIHLCFFSHSIKLRSLPLSVMYPCITCQDVCVQRHMWQNAYYRNVKWTFEDLLLLR